MFQHPYLVTVISSNMVADPGFPQRVAPTSEEAAIPIIWPIFVENCMKMKKFWARGRAAGPRAIRSATELNAAYFQTVLLDIKKAFSVYFQRKCINGQYLFS